MHKLDFNIDPDCFKFARSKTQKPSNLWTSRRTQIKQYGTSTVMFSASDSFTL